MGILCHLIYSLTYNCDIGGMLRRGRGGASYGEYSGGGVNPRSRLIDTEGDVLMGGDAGCDDSSKR